MEQQPLSAYQRLMEENKRLTEENINLRREIQTLIDKVRVLQANAFAAMDAAEQIIYHRDHKETLGDL